jgi:hypothetical protein
MEDLLKIGLTKKEAELFAEAKKNFYEQNEHIDKNSVSSVSSIPENKPFEIIGVSAYKEGDKIGDSVINRNGAIVLDNGFEIVPCTYKTTLGNIGAKHFARVSNWGKFAEYAKRPSSFGTFDENLSFGLWAQTKKVQFIVTKINNVPIRNAKADANGNIPTQKQYEIEVFESGKTYGQQ